MKRNIILASVFSLFVFAMSAAAQNKSVDFSGTWALDVSKSKLGDRNMIESQTLTVTQTDKDIKVETATKRLSRPADSVQGEKMPPMPSANAPQGERMPPPADAPQGGRMGGGRMGGGMMGGRDETVTFSLDGKETKTEMPGPMGSIPVSLKAKFDAVKLKLSRNSTMNGPMGEMTISSNETWELSADGKTLTINVDRSGPRGNETATKVFTRKS